MRGGACSKSMEELKVEEENRGIYHKKMKERGESEELVACMSKVSQW